MEILDLIKCRKILNLKVKYRESFRPFAPSVLREDLSSWFDLNVDSPYMLLVANIHHSKKIEMSKEQEKLFGIEKLNIKRSDNTSCNSRRLFSKNSNS